MLERRAGGAAFRLSLLIGGVLPTSAATSPAGVAEAGAHARVLVVDDEAEIADRCRGLEKPFDKADLLVAVKALLELEPAA